MWCYTRTLQISPILIQCNAEVRTYTGISLVSQTSSVWSCLARSWPQLSTRSRPRSIPESAVNLTYLANFLPTTRLRGPIAQCLVGRLKKWINMLSIVPVGKFLGAAVLGTTISAGFVLKFWLCPNPLLPLTFKYRIYGISCLQVYLYYTRYGLRDKWILKATVGVVW